MSTVLAILLMAQAAPAATPASRPVESTTATQPVTVEYYYRIKWGSMNEFMRLYRKNHQPVLAAMQQQGFITAMRMEQPFTHLAGGERWDLRVTITFKDAESAVGGGGAYDRAAGAAMDRLYSDVALHTREEAQRFALVEEHWDVIVNTVDEE